ARPRWISDNLKFLRPKLAKTEFDSVFKVREDIDSRRRKTRETRYPMTTIALVTMRALRRFGGASATSSSISIGLWAPARCVP
ncbi:MAG: hypothetical protein WBE98_11060, partial [Gammaproteobacteria bacterium]